MKKIFSILLSVLSILFILSALVSCGDSGERLSEVTEVRYDAKSEKLSVTATLDARSLKQYKHDTIYLIEVPANNTEADIATLVPVSQSKPEKEMHFTLPIKSGAQTSLYSGFVIAAFDRSNGYTAIGDIRYISNPEALASNTSDYPSYSSIKGLNIVSSSDAVLLGVKHTVIRVPIEDYMVVSDGEDSIATTFDGNSYCLSASKISELDYKIKNMTGAGIEVYLEFTLDTPPEELDSGMALLASKSAEAVIDSELGGSDKHYAISVNTGEGYRRMAAFFEFIAARYTRTDKKYGFAAAYIIGHGVNSLSETSTDDPRTLSDSAERCVKLLRIASTALRSNYKNGKIFVSLNNVWCVSSPEESGEETPPTSLATEFGVKEYLTELVKKAYIGGEFGFSVALMPSPSSETSSVWSDPLSTASDESERITVCNLSLITSLLDEETMKYDGKNRELMIYNYGISALDGNAQAASYAFAFYKAYEAGVTAFIYNGHWDHTTGNGMTGLYSTDEDGGAASKRAIYDIFEMIDVKDSDEPFSAPSLIGAQWKTLYAEYADELKTTTLTSSTGSTTSSEDSGKKKISTKTLYDFTGGDILGFYPSDSAKSVEIGEMIGERALRAELAARYTGEKMGVRSAPIAYETIKSAKQLIAIIKADTTVGNTARVTLALTQSGSDESTLFTAEASVQAGNRQTVYFDLSSFSPKEALGDVTAYFWIDAEGGRSSFYSDEESEVDTELQKDVLFIESVSITSLSKGKSFLPMLIFILIAILAVFFLYYKYRKAAEAKKRAARRRRPPQPTNGPRRSPGTGRPPQNGSGYRTRR